MAEPLQPLLHDALVTLRAPTQVWSAADGSMGRESIHGIYHADVRLARGLRILIDDREPEHLATGAERTDAIRVDALVRTLDDPSPDPGVRLIVNRSVETDSVREVVTLRSRRDVEISAHVEIRIEPDASAIDLVKLGRAPSSQLFHRPDGQGSGIPNISLHGGSASWSGDRVTARLTGVGLGMAVDEQGLCLTADLLVPPAGEAEVAWTLELTDAAAVVHGVIGAAPWSRPEIMSADDRLTNWVAQGLTDLDALRMTTERVPDATFIAAGAPWFLTLFGRDSLWTARMLLPLGTQLAGDTLRLLAAFQGTRLDESTAEEPGKIMHELRRAAVSIDDGDGELPPLYFGTVDATALWILLLCDAWRWGLPDDDVRALLPNLQDALSWMRDYGDADGDGLLEYIDRSGRGLANQGWKDSGDSVQWHDGTLAEGPIALSEVQAYAYAAAMGAADLLDAFDASGADEWRAWAGQLRERFHAAFWIDDADGAYPAIALDAQKAPVDSITSNIGHLLGTGILDAEQVDRVVRRLRHPSLDSGYGLRTLSDQSAGYWPLSYHGGTVWAHDTAIAVLGLAREGRGADAHSLIQGLLRAAAGFGYRMPELHSGDPRGAVSSPIPYPAACRPQAWSAAASIAVLTAVLGLEPDGDDLRSNPISSFGPIAVHGLRSGGHERSVVVG